MNSLIRQRIFILLLLLPWTAACSIEAVSPAGAVEGAAEPTRVAAAVIPSPTALNPPLVVASTAPAAVVAAPATATPHPTVETAQRHAAAAVEIGDEATALDNDPTPMPTFTLPALPFTSVEEHYWLRRPVPEDGVVWTDKVYPYGGTRSGQLRPHHGVEFMVPTGTPMLAAAGGTVVVAGHDGKEIYGPQPDFYGKLIVIELESRYNGQPVYILYGHLSEVLVTVGQVVQTGSVIALSGGTGLADGPHLHFEVRLGQNDYDHTRNPLLWIYPFPDYGTVAGRIVWPDGSAAYELPVSLRRLDAPSRYLATTTYAGDSLNPSDIWNENFALDDVPAGYYEVSVRLSDNRRLTEEIWVYAYRTTFVEIVLEE